MTAATATKTKKVVSAKKQAKRDAYHKQVRAQLDEASALADAGDYGDDLTAEEIDKAIESLTTHYSLGNAVLILTQAALLGLEVKGLADVGGAKAFEERGRKLNGYQARVIFVWARVVRVTEEEKAEADTKVETDEKGQKVFYRPVGIYHVSQTVAA